MSLSRRAFARTLGLGGAGVLSADFISGRGFEHLMAMGLQERRAPRGADAIVISSNENPRGPSPAALEAIRGRTTYAVGRYPDNVEELTDVIAKMYGASRAWRMDGSAEVGQRTYPPRGCVANRARLTNRKT